MALSGADGRLGHGEEVQAQEAPPAPDAIASRTVDPLSAGLLSVAVLDRRSILYRICRSLLIGMLKIWFRPTVRGRPNVPRSGPVIIAPVHRSNIDFAFSALVTDRMLYFMAKEELWKQRCLGRLLEAFGVFPVHRSGADRESVRRAEEVLARGQVLVMFPEGARRSGDQVSELLEGVAFLAARTGATIVPLGIGGSARAMPKGAKFAKPVRITISVGDPIEVPERAAKRRIPRAQIHHLSEELQRRLQAAYDEAGR